MLFVDGLTVPASGLAVWATTHRQPESAAAVAGRRSTRVEHHGCGGWVQRVAAVTGHHHDGDIGVSISNPRMLNRVHSWGFGGGLMWKLVDAMGRMSLIELAC
jgi:hypothetical protein